ncbi:MAG: RNA-binding S4 domain-containing protein [Tissierellales bacterium]|nr:RNA-binding S4 domain-containing protein [Tissierellales bacterium]
MVEVKIEGEFIKLQQFLKYIDVAQTDGHAKILINDGNVKVNGDIEYQRGKKLYKNDIIEVEDEVFKIIT